MPEINSRWDTYVMASGAGLMDLFMSHFGSSHRKVCFIMGRGFDPRMNLGLAALLDYCPQQECVVILLEFSEGPSSPSNRYAKLVAHNTEEFSDIASRGGIEVRGTRLNMFSMDGRRIGSRAAADLFKSSAEFDAYTDIIVDVSSLPSGIFYPLIAKLLYLLDVQKAHLQRQNLFVLVSENSAIDQQILDEGIDEEADYVDLFRSGADRMAAAGHPKIWIPILGEAQELQLRRIHDLVGPDEICPLLPSPSPLPRRADMLVSEYHRLLFDQMRVEPQNFIYASEQNPFEVCRQVRRTVLHYNQVLQPLGGCRAIVSCASSKLLSIGALLAAYELKRAKLDIAIAHIEAHGYTIQEEQTIRALTQNTTIFGLWLLGECYA